MENLLTLILGLVIGILIMYFYCYKKTKSGGPVGSPVEPKGLISPTEAKTLNDNWTDLRKVANDAVAENEIDNRSSWYSIEDVRNYLTLVENDNDSITGIRLYLGVHKDISEGGKTTIFMVPTIPNPRPKTGEDPNDDDPNAKGLDRSDDGMPPGASYPN